MALLASNYLLPQGTALPAAYLKIDEATVRMTPAASGAATFNVPVVTIFYRVFLDVAARKAGAPPFADTPIAQVTNPIPDGSATHMAQLYAWLAHALGVPNQLV